MSASVSVSVRMSGQVKWSSGQSGIAGGMKKVPERRREVYGIIHTCICNYSWRQDRGEYDVGWARRE